MGQYARTSGNKVMILVVDALCEYGEQMLDEKMKSDLQQETYCESPLTEEILTHLEGLEDGKG